MRSTASRSTTNKRASPAKKEAPPGEATLLNFRFNNRERRLPHSSSEPEGNRFSCPRARKKGCLYANLVEQPVF